MAAATHHNVQVLPHDLFRSSEMQQSPVASVSKPFVVPGGRETIKLCAKVKAGDLTFGCQTLDIIDNGDVMCGFCDAEGTVLQESSMSIMLQAC